LCLAAFGRDPQANPPSSSLLDKTLRSTRARPRAGVIRRLAAKKFDPTRGRHFRSEPLVRLFSTPIGRGINEDRKLRREKLAILPLIEQILGALIVPERGRRGPKVSATRAQGDTQSVWVRRSRFLQSGRRDAGDAGRIAVRSARQFVDEPRHFLHNAIARSELPRPRKGQRPRHILGIR
jgi:hypothetical protein